MPRLRNTLEVTGIPEDCTVAEVEDQIVLAADGDSFTQMHMDAESYEHFRTSENIHESQGHYTPPEGDPDNNEDGTYEEYGTAGKATVFYSESQGRLLIINAFASLMQQHNATPFPKE